MRVLPVRSADIRSKSVLTARTVWRARFLVVAASAILCATMQPAWSHSRRSDTGPARGIAIPNLTHGQMAVIADYRDEILRVAARRQEPDMQFRRVLNFANIQFSYCMWGLVPLSVTDEASPFNECSHAYLAATQAVLLRMRGMPGRHGDVDDLVSRIETDMVRNDASLVLCQYSNESFNTANVIRPDWKGLFRHMPSLTAFAAFLLALAGGIAAVIRMTSPVDGPSRG